MTRTTRTARGLAVVAALALTVAGCGGGSSGNGPSASGGDNKPVDGGTLTFLTLQDQLQHLDPQRNYTGEDLAFSSAYFARTLTAYKMSPDGVKAGELVGDLATDTGKPTEEGKTWAFTLRDGVKWEDGKDITCEGYAKQGNHACCRYVSCSSHTVPSDSSQRHYNAFADWCPSG